MILAADVGGTKTLIGLFERGAGRPRAVREERFPSAEFDSFEAMVAAFLSAGRASVTRCAVGVAGPIVAGKSQVVNLPWPVDGPRLARRLGLDRVHLLNDVEATAWGIPELRPAQLASLTPRLRVRPGNAALIAAGTGLGMALLPHDGRRHHPIPSEGGHQDFGPRDEFEVDLLSFLEARHGRVSWERVVSGPALPSLYRFLIESGRRKERAPLRRLLSGHGDPSAAIAEAGLAGTDPVAVEALDRFVSLYGSAAGNLALVGRAVGGVFVGGGIAPKILERLRSGAFMKSFREKGRLTPLLERIPVKVILEPRTALLGAAARAALDR